MNQPRLLDFKDVLVCMEVKDWTHRREVEELTCFSGNAAFKHEVATAHGSPILWSKKESGASLATEGKRLRGLFFTKV